ncbi:transposase [Paenarthrobacter sp. MMS21-TAE1-1]|uniref:Transposase n=1 Tax=Paenarthrobacter aromaticivorans TaxID=2849150 RepID=A0ABS6IAB8_9MICC|nr:transposase [Paenarthrobacter sp. MMS21-TAE1-1]MBU8867786.1 transposase [Paenarthrobacter sp. MMS21-TAE1-1]
MVRAAAAEAYLLKLPDVDALSPRMLGIDEHRFRSVRYFQEPGTKTWTRFEPWMTTIVYLDTGQVLGGMVDGRDHKGIGDWPFARPLEWRMWLPRTAPAVDHFHLISLANQAMTETRQKLYQQVKGRRGRAIDQAWARRMLLLCGGDTLCCRAALRLEEVFAVDDPTGTLQAVWKVREQLRHLLAPAPWRMPPQPKTFSKNSLRQWHDLRRTGSTALPADGGKRSRCSSSPPQLPARSRPTTPRSKTSNAPPVGTASPPTTNRLSLLRSAVRTAA